MKAKLKPKKIPKDKHIWLYWTGSHSRGSFNGMGKKTNLICSNVNCGYNTRLWKNNPIKANKISKSSHNCPIHGNILIDVGDGAVIPKKGSKARRKLIEQFLTYETSRRL